MNDDDLTTAYILGVEHIRGKMHKLADEIERLRAENDKLRNALFAIVNEVGFHNPMRMTTEISDKVLFEAAGVLNDKT